MPPMYTIYWLVLLMYFIFMLMTMIMFIFLTPTFNEMNFIKSK